MRLCFHHHLHVRSRRQDLGKTLLSIVLLAIPIVSPLIEMRPYNRSSQAIGFVYFKDPWNLMDIFIVIEGLVSLVETWNLDGSKEASSGEGNLKVLRTIRVLRPLRTAHHVPSAKMIVEGILSALPGEQRWQRSRLNFNRLCTIAIFVCCAIQNLKATVPANILAAIITPAISHL